METADDGDDNDDPEIYMYTYMEVGIDDLLRSLPALIIL